MDTAVNFPTTPKAVKAAALKLNKRMSVEQAFQVIARSCIDQVRANEAGVLRFHHGESLHQMRVGLRRLRAALAMFDDLVHTPEPIRTELAWMSAQLSQARDWNGLLGSTLPQVEGAVEGQGTLAQLRQATQEKLAATHARAAEAVASPRAQGLLNRVDDWLEQRDWREQLTNKEKMRLKLRAADFAKAMLEKERERLLKRGSKLKVASPEQRHRVRIAAKRTRYAAEFFASLFPAKRIRPYVAALTSLQRELGYLNDAAVGARLLDDLCAGDDGLREEAALVRGYLAAGAEQGALRLRRVWKQLAPVPAPH